MSKLSDKTLDALTQAFARLFDEGYLRVYGDRAEPLVEWRLPKPAVRSASGGVVELNPLIDVRVPMRGRPFSFKFFRADGKTEILEGTAGKEGRELNLGVEWLEENALVSLTGYRHVLTVVGGGEE